jgi:hypothetical protein
VFVDRDFTPPLGESAPIRSPRRSRARETSSTGLPIAGVCEIDVQAILATRGSSIGKRILGLYVVTEPGRNSRLGFGRGVILRILVPNVVTSATGGLFFLIDQAFIFRDDRRCIHDHIAGTVVLADPRWQDVANDDTGLAPSP